MRDHILLFVNGVEHRVNGDAAFLTLSDFLRDHLQLCGTKIVCSEGDCGSCSVLCGVLNGDSRSFKYQSIDSCIRFVFQLDGCHIVTVEGLSTARGSEEAELSPVQQAMVDCHGSQCGYCTPGFVVAMTGVLEEHDSPSVDDWRHELTGNLCRCTGYSPIVAAGVQAASMPCKRLSDRFEESEMADAISSGAADSVRIEADEKSVLCPTSLDEAVQYLADQPDAKIVAGGTDVGVQFNKGRCEATKWLDLNKVSEITHVEVGENEIVAGAGATWSCVKKETAEQFPQFQRTISLFGSPQIRHVGTIGGNLINASPIADSIPFLFINDAQLELVSAKGSRTIAIEDFYTDYKKFDLQPGELLKAVRIPLITKGRTLELYKVSRRLDMDISSFTAAISMEVTDGCIENARIAMGAVGPIVVRLRDTEKFLNGSEFSQATMREAGEIAIGEITPISDVRGGADYRFQLAKNVLLKFYQQHHDINQEALA